MTALQQVERAAMTGDRTAILTLVSAVRQWRAATQQLLEGHYLDGEHRDLRVGAFVDTVQRIESLEEP